MLMRTSESLSVTIDSIFSIQPPRIQLLKKILTDI